VSFLQYQHLLESSGKGHTLMLPFVWATDVLANGVWIHVDTNLPPQSFISYIEYDWGEQHLAILHLSNITCIRQSAGTDFYNIYLTSISTTPYLSSLLHLSSGMQTWHHACGAKPLANLVPCGPESILVHMGELWCGSGTVAHTFYLSLLFSDYISS